MHPCRLEIGVGEKLTGCRGCREGGSGELRTRERKTGASSQRQSPSRLAHPSRKQSKQRRCRIAIHKSREREGEMDSADASKRGKSIDRRVVETGQVESRGELIQVEKARKRTGSRESSKETDASRDLRRESHHRLSASSLPLSHRHDRASLVGRRKEAERLLHRLRRHVASSARRAGRRHLPSHLRRRAASAGVAGQVARERGPLRGERAARLDIGRVGQHTDRLGRVVAGDVELLHVVLDSGVEAGWRGVSRGEVSVVL